MLFKINERQYGVLLHTVLLQTLMQDLMLIYPNNFSHYSGSVLKGILHARSLFIVKVK